jgi:hypothetical protein
MSEKTPRARYAVIILVTVAMLFAAVAVVAELSPGAAPTSSRTLSAASTTCGQVAVPLASATSYAVLASSTVTNTGATAITGDVGLSPGSSVTGFPPGKITGLENVTTPSAAHAEANLTVAYNDASGRSNCPVAVAGNIGGQTLTPGLYRSTSSLAISSGDLTLSGGGNPNGIFIFQVASTLTTTAGRTVILSNGAQAGNVYWQIGSSATLGTTSVMMGTVMAHDSISMLTGSTLNGRALAETGEVSLADSAITVPTTANTPTYAATFTESGLVVGTSWSVTLGGVLISSTAGTIVFSVVSGSYAYAVSVAGYIAAPSSGTLVVSGAPANQAIGFTAAIAGTYTITFTESGLAAGTSWAVTLNGILTSSTTAAIVFSLASGTYAYTLGVVTDFMSAPSSGSVTLNGADGSQTITFSSTGSGGGGGGGSPAPGITMTDWLLIGGIVAVVAIVGGAYAIGRRPKVVA